MNSQQFIRTELLIGKEALNKLHNARVAVIGLGGVGSSAAEALVRAGVGELMLVDFDVINLSNLNRQLLALHSSVGKPKTEVMAERLKDINPSVKLRSINEFMSQENRQHILQDIDYLIDAIDSLGPKIGLLEFCVHNNLKVISVMGAGNRLNPEHIHISDLSKSYNCPLAKRVRKFLRRRGVNGGIPVVYSSELPLKPEDDEPDDTEDKQVYRGRERKTVGSISYLPAMMGMMAASWIIRQIISS